MLDRNILKSILYLIYLVLLEKKYLLIGILVFCFLLWTPMALTWTKSDGSAMGYYFMSLIVTLPIISISLILIPIIHQQIFSSSIKLRMEATGMSMKYYGITMVLMFTALLTIIFYLNLAIFSIFFSEVYGLDAQYSDEMVYVLQFKASYSLINILILPVICISGLVSFGYLLSLIRINELIKGIIIFVIIFLSIFVNFGTINPMLKIGEVISNDSMGNVNVAMLTKQKIMLSNLILLNPIGTISYSLQTTINSDVEVFMGDHISTINDVLMKNDHKGCQFQLVTKTNIVALLYSTIISGMAITLSW